MNDNISEGEINDILNEIMDEEFDTLLEDNSVNEISMSLVRQLHRCTKGNFDEVRADFVHLPPVARWLEPGAPKIVRQQDSDSDSSDDDDDEDMDQDDADDDGANGAPRQQNGNRQNNSGVSQMDEDGWMTVTARRRQR